MAWSSFFLKRIKLEPLPQLNLVLYEIKQCIVVFNFLIRLLSWLLAYSSIYLCFDSLQGDRQSCSGGSRGGGLLQPGGVRLQRRRKRTLRPPRHTCSFLSPCTWWDQQIFLLIKIIINVGSSLYPKNSIFLKKMGCGCLAARGRGGGATPLWSALFLLNP